MDGVFPDTPVHFNTMSVVTQTETVQVHRRDSYLRVINEISDRD